MSKRSHWLAGSAVLVAVVAVVLLWRGCRSDDADRPPTKPGEFAADKISFTSPDIDLHLLSVRATAHPSYTDWACLLECRERGGCGADVRVRLVYVVVGDERTLMMSGRLEAARGETIRIGRVQRPPSEVDRVKAVIVEMVAPYTSSAVRPTPVQ